MPKHHRAGGGDGGGGGGEGASVPYEPLDMSRLSRELSPLSALSSLILAPYEHRRRSGDQRLSFKRQKSHRLIKYYLVQGLCSHSLVSLGSDAVFVQYPQLTAY
jgi:hypothetical protein